MRILSAAEVDIAARLLTEGELVAIPTETVYGLGANALDPEAVAHIYEAKGRPSDNPLIIHIYGAQDLAKYTRDIPDIVWRLTDIFWPGPLTIVLRRADIIPDCITAGMDTVAVRCPRTEVTRELLRQVDFPVAAPSANTSGRPSTTTVAHVIEDLDGKVPAVLDGGDCQYGLESTILDMSGDEPCLLRPGAVTLEELEAVLGRIKIDKAVLAPLSEGEKPKAPGMKYRHYAPKAPLTMVRGSADATAAYIDGLIGGLLKKHVTKCNVDSIHGGKARKTPVNADEIRNAVCNDAASGNIASRESASRDVASSSGKAIGILCFDEYARHYEQMQGEQALTEAGICLDIVPYGPVSSRMEQAHELFDRLREFDKKDVDAIYAQCLDDTGIGLAIVNRLSKAAGFHIVDVE